MQNFDFTSLNNDTNMNAELKSGLITAGGCLAAIGIAEGAKFIYGAMKDDKKDDKKDAKKP